MYWEAKLLISKNNEFDDVEKQIIAIKEKCSNWGYRTVHAYLRKEGTLINHKRTRRIIQDHGLQASCFSHKSCKFSTYKGTFRKSGS